MRNKKLIIPFTIFMLILGMSVLAFNNIDPDRPLNNEVVLTSDGTVNLVATVRLLSGNLSNVSFYTDTGGVWVLNQTNATENLSSTFAVSVERSVVLVSIADDTTLKWGCRARDNASGESYCVNRTFSVQYPPFVAIYNPTDGAWINTRNFDVNFSVNSTSTSDKSFDCVAYSNSSGTWTPLIRGITANNNSGGATFNQFSTSDVDSQNTQLGVRCVERTNSDVFGFSNNFTIKIDTTNPVITLNGPADGSSDSDGVVDFTYTVTDVAPLNCSVYVIGTTGGSWTSNRTNGTSSLTSGVETNITITTLAEDETYTWNVRCQDEALNIGFASSNRTIILDQTIPTIDSHSNSSINSCTEFQLAWTTNENTNGSVTYGLDGGAITSSAVSSEVSGTSHTVNVDFTGNDGKHLFVNVTSYDVGNNVNANTQYIIQAPVGLCNTGGVNGQYSFFSVLTNTLNLSEATTQSGAEFAFWFNERTQDWVTHQNGTSVNALVQLVYGDAIILQSENNVSWQRLNTTSGHYFRNLSSGYNFLGVHLDRTFDVFGNTMKNVSSGNITIVDGLDLQGLDSYSVYNNTADVFFSHVRDTTYNNATTIPYGSVVIVWSDGNFTWNGTSIDRNWTVS